MSKRKGVNVMSDADKAYALRLPMWLYKDIEKLAQREMCSVNNMMTVLLREAVAERGMGQ